MSWIRFHPDELEIKMTDPSQRVGPQPEGNDGENTFFYQDTTGSGVDNELKIGMNVPVERGVSYAELRKMNMMSDAKLQQYIDEEDADDNEDKFEDREDYQSNADLLEEGNMIYNNELKKYNKTHNIKKQSVTYSDYLNLELN